MRYILKYILIEEPRNLPVRTRDKMEPPQKLREISEIPRLDIETEKSMCGSLTTVLLLGLQSYTKSLIQCVCKKYSEKYRMEMQSL